MQFMNSSVDKLVRNLTKNDFKSLTEEFGFKNLKRLKKRMFILMSTWTVLKDLVKKNWLMKNVFTALKKMEQLVIMVKNWSHK